MSLWWEIDVIDIDVIDLYGDIVVDERPVAEVAVNDYIALWVICSLSMPQQEVCNGIITTAIGDTINV